MGLRMELFENEFYKLYGPLHKWLAAARRKLCVRIVWYKLLEFSSEKRLTIYEDEFRGSQERVLNLFMPGSKI